MQLLSDAEYSKLTSVRISFSFMYALMYVFYEFGSSKLDANVSFYNFSFCLLYFGKDIFRSDL